MYKKSVINEMTLAELRRAEVELREEVFRLRFQHRVHHEGRAPVIALVVAHNHKHTGQSTTLLAVPVQQLGSPLIRPPAAPIDSDAPPAALPLSRVRIL